MNDYLDKQREARTSPNVVWVNYEESKKDYGDYLHVFIENKDDTVLYYTMIKRYSKKSKIRLMKCQNKIGVLKVARLIGGDVSNTIFIVDRDHDEFLLPDMINKIEEYELLMSVPKHVYTTDNYSIDSHFMLAEVFVSALNCFLHFENHVQEDEIRLEKYKTLREHGKEIIEVMTEYTIHHLHNRRTRTSDMLPKLKITGCKSFDDYKAILSEFSARLTESNINCEDKDYIALTQIIRMCPNKYVSPKEVCEYMIKIYNLIVTELTDEAYLSNNKRVKDKSCTATHCVSVGKTNYTHCLAVFVEEPQSLIEYIGSRVIMSSTEAGL